LRKYTCILTILAFLLGSCNTYIVKNRRVEKFAFTIKTNYPDTSENFNYLQKSIQKKRIDGVFMGATTAEFTLLGNRQIKLERLFYLKQVKDTSEYFYVFEKIESGAADTLLYIKNNVKQKDKFKFSGLGFLSLRFTYRP